MTNPPINLELVNAINQHEKVIIPISGPKNRDLTIQSCSDYWMRKKRGQGWIILTIDIHTFGFLFWEDSLDKIGHTKLGAIRPSSDPLQGMRSPSVMCIIEADKWTPPFIQGLAEATMLRPDARMIILEHKGDW